MTSKELFAMLFERGNAMQSFWGFYITVSGALLAFFGSAQRSKKVGVVLSVAFVAFAAVNGDGMVDIAKQRQAVWDLLPSASDNGAWAIAPQKVKSYLAAVSKPPTPFSVAAFHIAGDITVLIALWLLILLPREAALSLETTEPAASDVTVTEDELIVRVCAEIEFNILMLHLGPQSCQVLVMTDHFYPSNRLRLSAILDLLDHRENRKWINAQTLSLVDGRRLSAPLAWYPRLLHASIEERNEWELIGDGEGIHWPRIDEDLSISGILRGVPARGGKRAG